MFDFILYPVSAILWFWHKVFGFMLGPDNGFAWALSVFFLVFSLRLLLLKPALSQIRAGRQMQKFAPQIQKLREKYKNDRQKMAQEMQKLQSEQGVNPLGGCLPALVQIPVFLSLFYVLRGFKPGKDSNYIFGQSGVDSFLNADIFGAKLGNWITQPTAELQEFGTSRPEMITVGIPLMIVASAATYFTMRMSVKRQNDATMANPQGAMIGKVMMYLAPIGTLISPWFLPMAVVLYFMANNLWTLGQQHFLTNKVDREEQREKERELAAKKEAPRPKPGQKPGQPVGDQASAVSGDEATQVEGKGATEVAGAPSANGSAGGGQGSDGQSGGKANGKAAGAGKANGKPTGSPAGKQGGKPSGKKGQQKNRPGKQTAARKSQKKRR
ncbi:YidC/Oxa1 family membrane protein insertase [Halopolyspora algeriensis]|uniref:Membrane protein insertase YidC n=1 Tax=Halopolyspora algeriensis TaxID=1500506 RepID=A0A368VI22_9ACTN|nr:membrane protein insertase YidC [Halopolyspora algeriensis]RCW40004.1 YidC/Oxa1 family membrane protein insertase [Halopolyspora algeriensis]TQM46558.1 YidC/Oxa1 family membrane protein insertase [Halopolyspora algeriensis]